MQKFFHLQFPLKAAMGNRLAELSARLVAVVADNTVLPGHCHPKTCARHTGRLAHEADTSGAPEAQPDKAKLPNTKTQNGSRSSRFVIA